MLITPLPGADRQILLDALRELGRRVGNLRGGMHEAKFPGYIGWANNAARVLRHQIRAIDIDRMVLTQRYWLLQSLNPVPNSNAFGSIIDLLETEIDERVAAFEEGSSALARQIERWSGPDVFVVADTSFYIQHTHPLDHLDFATLLATRHEPVRLLVPIIVIDELDGLKQHKERACPGQKNASDARPRVGGPHEACTSHRRRLVGRGRWWPSPWTSDHRGSARPDWA